MRNRLVAAFVGFSVAVIALLGVPRTFFLSDLIRSDAQQLVDRTADVAGELAAEVEAGGGTVSATGLERLLDEGERIVYVAPGGDRVVAPEDSRTGEGDLRATRDVPGGGQVTVSQSAEIVDGRVRDAVQPLILGALVVVLLAAGAGWLVADRLSRPFSRLAQKARQLGSGQLDIDVPHFGVPEAEEIGGALRESAARLDELLRREREVAVNASHELRTPVTAMRLALEDLAQWPDTSPAVSDELRRLVSEVDRLSAAITGLLDVSNARRLQEVPVFDLSAVVVESVGELRAHAAEAGVRIDLETDGPVDVRVAVEPVRRVLRLLLERACSGGHGVVQVRCADRTTHLEVRVGREGAPPPAGRAVGPALEEAGAVAAEVGGRIVLEGRSDDALLLLPRPVREPSGAGS